MVFGIGVGGVSGIWVVGDCNESEGWVLGVWGGGVVPGFVRHWGGGLGFPGIGVVGDGVGWI